MTEIDFANMIIRVVQAHPAARKVELWTEASGQFGITIHVPGKGEVIRTLNATWRGILYGQGFQVAATPLLSSIMSQLDNLQCHRPMQSYLVPMFVGEYQSQIPPQQQAGVNWHGLDLRMYMQRDTDIQPVSQGQLRDMGLTFTEALDRGIKNIDQRYSFVTHNIDKDATLGIIQQIIGVDQLVASALLSPLFLERISRPPGVYLPKLAVAIPHRNMLVAVDASNLRAVERLRCDTHLVRLTSRNSITSRIFFVNTETGAYQHDIPIV